MTASMPGPSSSRLGWGVIVAGLVLAVAIVYESFRHPTRDAKIKVFEGGKVEVDPLEESRFSHTAEV